jgi:hypothetical protein
MGRKRALCHSKRRGRQYSESHSEKSRYYYNKRGILYCELHTLIMALI